MTQAQTIFVVALGVVALLITVVGAYVLSSAFWSDRWYSGRPRGPSGPSERGTQGSRQP